MTCAGMTWQVLEGRWQDVLPAGFVADHLITDPPYSEHVHSKSRAGARKLPLRDGHGHLTRCAIDRAKEFGFDCMPEADYAAVAAIAVRRWSLIFSDVESAHKYRSPSAEYVRTCFWHRSNGTPQFSSDRPGSHIEAIVCLHRRRVRKRWNAGGRGNVFVHNVVNMQAPACANNTRCHPAQKPLPLMLELVGAFTSPGDLVLDLYCGGGTTGVACIRLGRHFLGIELNPEWAAIARERLAAEAESSTLAARQAGQQALFGGIP